MLTKTLSFQERKISDCNYHVKFIAYEKIEDNNIKRDCITEREFDENKIHFSNNLIPELLDISITKTCNLKCKYCYQSADEGKHMTLENLNILLEKFGNEKPFQVALGGGEPSMHPHFIEILKIFYNNNIIPSYTTNGNALFDDKIIEATEKYCGGIALTYHWENPEYFWKAFERLKTLRNIQKNIHFILRKNSLNVLKTIYDKVSNHIDSIIILEFHTVGRGTNFSNWIPNRNDIEELKNLLTNSEPLKLGVGASLVPILINIAIENNLPIEVIEQLYWNPESLLTGYVDENLYLAPSSFWEGEKINLRKYRTFKEAYNSKLMKDVRLKQFKLRDKCKYAYICNGGMHAQCHKYCAFS